MRHAVIVSTARTPIGRAYRGAFNDTAPTVLAAHAISHAVARAGAAPDEIDEPLPYGGRGTLQQIALEIESIEALLAAHEFLAAKGAKIVVPPRPQNWSGGMKFYFLDPDGVKIEISHGMKAVDLDYGSQYEIAQSIAAS